MSGERPAPNDEDFGHMHHALGSPAALTEATRCYRNYFCCAADGQDAKRFELIDCWDFSHTINEGRDAIYNVNRKGRVLLGDWLKARTAALSKAASAS